MAEWLETQSTQDWPERAIEVRKDKYGETIKEEGRVQNGILVSLVGVPDGASLTYEDITDGDSKLTIIGTTSAYLVNVQRTAYLAVTLPKNLTCDLKKPPDAPPIFKLAISDSISCDQPSKCDNNKKTTLTIELVWAK